MRPWLIVATLFLALGVSTAVVRSWPQRGNAPVVEQGPGEVYLALGDSLATGAVLSDPLRESYVALLTARLQGQGVTRLVNVGVAGATSESLLLQQLPRALSTNAQARAAGQRVSPITLGIGGNDLRAAVQGNEAERAAVVARAGNNIGQALDALRAAAPDADIAVMTYYDPFGTDQTIVGSEGYWVARLNEAIRREAAGREARVAEVQDAFGGGRAYEYTNILVGDVHANARGHAVIAEQLWQALGY